MKKITAAEIGEFLHARGYDKTRIGRLSIDTWILDSETTEESSNIFNEKPDWWSLCFTSLSRWKETDVNGRRSVKLTYMVSCYMFVANNFSEK